MATANEVMEQIKAKIGMKLDADGYGIFESSAGGWGMSRFYHFKIIIEIKHLDWKMITLTGKENCG